MTFQPFAGEIPDHVPPELVRNFPMRLGLTTTENPYTTVIPDIHRMPPVFWAPDAHLGMAPAWIFRRARDQTRIFLDTEHFSSRNLAPFSALVGGNWKMLPLEADPPEHMRYRMLLAPLLTPKKVAAMNDRVRQHARHYIDKFKDNGECEFIGEFAARFPIAVFLELFGLPIEEVEQFLIWEDNLLHEQDLDTIARAVTAVQTYIMQVVEKRRREPRDDLISYFTHTEVDGRKPTDDEIWGTCFTLYTGGLDTVTNSLGWHFRHLATHPDHQQQLRDNPALIVPAVEELLRAYSIATINRTCVKPVTVGGIELREGDRVMLATPLGSNDPDAYDNPQEVRFDREPRHLAFGSGVHNCVGLRLARRELHIAIEEILGAIPSFRIKPGAEVVANLGSVLSQQSLPLVW